MRRTLTFPALVARSPGNPGRRVGVLVGVLGVSLASILFALIAITAEPLPVAFAIAVLLGVPLLFKPDWLVSIIVAAGLLVVGIVPLWAEGPGAKAVWGVSLMGIALLAVSLFVGLTRRSATRDTPAFVWVMLAFLAYVVLNSVIQFYSLFEFVGGFKRYFQMTGLIFALAWLSFDEGMIRWWRRLFLGIALVQLPFSLYERIVWVPFREGIRSAFPGMVPIDVVGGTLGASRTSGGASGEMAFFLILAGLFLLSRLTERQLPTKRFLMALPLILGPLFLGEVKAVVVMLPLALFVFFRHEIFRRPHYALLGLMVGGALTVAAGLALVQNMKSRSADNFIDKTISYNFEDKGYGGYVLNRTTALTFWAKEQGLYDPVSLVLGNGMSASHASSGGHLTTNRYAGMGIGLTGASTLLWDTGAIGTTLFFLVHLLVWNAAGRLRKQSSEVWVRADAYAIQAAMPLFVFFVFYHLGVLEQMGIQIVFCSMLGYLAWLCRRQSHMEAIGKR